MTQHHAPDASRGGCGWMVVIVLTASQMMAWPMVWLLDVLASTCTYAHSGSL